MDRFARVLAGGVTNQSINALYMVDGSSNHLAMPKRGWIIWMWLVLRLVASGRAADTVVPAPAGLPQRSVIAMTQTRDGYLWLGTTKGLARFDGNRYEVFNEWNTPGLQRNTIVQLFEDSRGTLWVGAENTVAVVAQGAVQTLEIPGGSAPVQSICEDRTGAVWLYLADGRLVRWRENRVQNIWVTEARSGNVRKVFSDVAGQVWIATEEQVLQVVSDLAAEPFELLVRAVALPGAQFVLPSRGGGFWHWSQEQLVRVTTTPQLEAREVARNFPWGRDRINAVCEDHAGRLVVGTYANQVYRLDAAGQFQRIEGLPKNAVLSLWEDREDNLWVGTDGAGLYRVRENPFRVVAGTENSVVQSVAADALGGLWFGFNGEGARYFGGGQVREVKLALAPDRLALNFWSVLADSAGRVWAGTRDQGLFQFTGEQFELVRDARLTRRNVAALFEARNGQIHVGTDQGLAIWNGRDWRWLDQQSGLSANQVTALAEDRQGNLWIGTERGGLNRWREGRFSAVHVADGLPSENITALWVDRDDVLWVGTGNGLGRLEAGRWTKFTRQDGLVSDSISYLLEDDQEHLWVGANVGLMRLTKKSLAQFAAGKTTTIACRVYSERDGLPTDECTQGSQPAACRTADGRLWFPTIRGLVTVNPAELRPNTNAPLVAIESIWLNDRLQTTNRLLSASGGRLVIPPGVERVEFSFTSLNLTAPDRARFRYWLVNHETGWNAPTERRSVSYSRLAPGSYQFRVKASNEDGWWNADGITLDIEVLPPFWQTWWFRAGVGVVVVGLLAGGVYFVSTQKLQRQLALLRQQEALEKERARIARDLHDQLGANLTQMSLLGEMVEEDKQLPEEITQHAQQICQTARTTSDALDEIVWAANPSNDTLEGLINYACKYAQEYLALAGLRYRLEVPAQLPEQNIPPELRHNVFLAFKESVNNVVKHARAAEVKIRLRLAPQQFILEIEDDGRGPAEATTKTGRNGLLNMRKRMEDVGGKFTLQPGAERGTLVRLTAPLLKR